MALHSNHLLNVALVPAFVVLYTQKFRLARLWYKTNVTIYNLVQKTLLQSKIFFRHVQKLEQMLMNTVYPSTIRKADDREVWRKIVYDATNPRIEDDWGQDRPDKRIANPFSQRAIFIERYFCVPPCVQWCTTEQYQRYGRRPDGNNWQSAARFCSKATHVRTKRSWCMRNGPAAFAISSALGQYKRLWRAEPSQR